MAVIKLLSESKILVHVLVCCFGIASWVDINGLWVELPILVTYLPEKWTLPSYIIIISQVANIGPIIYGCLLYCTKSSRLDKPVSGIIVGVGMVACVMLALFWKQTTYLGDELHATALFVLNFTLALVDCTSSMAFLAFMAIFKSHYLPAFFIGEGLSGMLPALIALAQGAGNIVCTNNSQTTSNFTNGSWFNETTYSVYPVYETPRFSVQVFFLILFGMMSASMISFLLLNFHPYCKQEQVGKSSYDLPQDDTHKEDAQIKYVVTQKENKLEESPSETKNDYGSISPKQSGTRPIKTDEEGQEKLSPGMFAYLLASTALINMQITSFLLSVQSYTSLPYGLETYHLTAIITNIANPVACFISLLIPLTSGPAISLLTFLGTGFSIYLITLATMSPNPPLVGQTAGGALAVTSWAMASFLLTYSKVSIAGRLRRGGRRPLLWYGAATQIGALTGAVVAFCLVNVFKVLKDAPYC